MIQVQCALIVSCFKYVHVLVGRVRDSDDCCFINGRLKEYCTSNYNVLKCVRYSGLFHVFKRCSEWFNFRISGFDRSVVRR